MTWAHVAPAAQSQGFAWALTGGDASLARARQQFEQWLADQAVETEDAADLILVLSELAANALAATGGDHDEPIGIRAWRARSGVVLEVENAIQARLDGIVASTDSDPLRGSGRGLLIVAAYTDEVEVIPPSQASGLIVRCHKRVGPLANHAEDLARTPAAAAPAVNVQEGAR